MNYLVCSPQEGAPAGTICPAGYTLELTGPPPAPLPTPADFEVAGWAFGLVLISYVLGAGIGALLRLLRS